MPYTPQRTISRATSNRGFYDGNEMSRTVASRDGWRVSQTPKMGRSRISELSKQRTQQLPLEFSRFNQTKVTFKHFDKNRYTLAFSRQPVRSHWFDRDANHCQECHKTEA